MFKDLQDTFKEWVPAVPKRWYNMLLNVIVPIIPFVAGLIFAIEQSTKGLPVPTWVWAMIIASVVLFVVLSFFAFHRVKSERDKVISSNSERNTDLRRQERKEQRHVFRTRLEIPILLFQMYERAKILCGENRKPLTKEYWDEIAHSFFEAHQAPTVVLPLDKMPSIQEIMDMINSTPDPFNTGSASTIENFNRLILNLQATMSLHNTGAIPLTNNDDEYQKYHKKVKLLQNNLPNTINTKIKDCILLSNGLANLLCVDFGATETHISDGLLIAIQYILPHMDNWAQKMRDEISNMIQDFLLGN